MNRLIAAVFILTAALCCPGVAGANTGCDSELRTQQTLTGTMVYDAKAFYRTGSAYGFKDDNGVFWKVYALGPLVGPDIETGMAPYLDKKIRLTACFSEISYDEGIADTLIAAEFI